MRPSGRSPGCGLPGNDLRCRIVTAQLAQPGLAFFFESFHFRGDIFMALFQVPLACRGGCLATFGFNGEQLELVEIEGAHDAHIFAKRIRFWHDWRLGRAVHTPAGYRGEAARDIKTAAVIQRLRTMLLTGGNME
jgi:hypothetical protein